MTDTARLLIDSQCALGEGPLWHPERQQLFYFDINNRSLFAAKADGTAAGQWSFDGFPSAAAIIGRDTLAIATETGLVRLDLATGATSHIAYIEADDDTTRSNDARVNHAGGWWIGTMRKQENGPGGALYQYRAGTLTTLLTDQKTPNSTCFSPDGRTAYYTDTPSRKIMQVAIDPATGLPAGDWRTFVDIPEDEGWPDGAIVDSAGYLWSARWGGSRVVRHAPDGSVDRIVHVPASQVTCPCLGGPELKTMFITTANKTMSAEQLAAERVAGGVFVIEVEVPGQPETPVIL
ncbi:MAG: gluconolactonase [Devosia sp.]|nr:gluconolactonase [Devosia sp.]